MKYLIGLVLLAMTAAACGDVLTLDDGSKIEGKARKSGDQWIVTDATGHETTVDPGRITSFHLTGSVPSPSVAINRLAMLREAVDHLTDLHAIVDRSAQFIKQNSGTPQAAQAQADLTMWQQRLSGNYKKAGARWLPPSEWRELAAGEARDALAIGDSIRHGDFDLAETLVRAELMEDSDNPSALYLQGLLFNNKDQIIPARADFERVLSVVGENAATENNLAVTLYRQQFYGAAMAAYVKAMNKMPDNRQILDNVVEALHALPADAQDSLPAQRAREIFADQDRDLRKAQEERGLFRWGSDWVTADKLADLTALKESREQKLMDLHEQVDALAGERAATAAHPPIPELTAMLPENNAFTGYSVLNLNPGIMGGGTCISCDLRNLQRQIANFEQMISKLEYAGVQRMIGPEGMPYRTQPAGATTTQPSARAN